MSDQTLYNTTAQTEGTLTLAHEKILRAKRGGVFENITGDANNVAGVPTAVTIQRENYGNKGLPSVYKIGDSWVITWDCEAVRDETGEIAQEWLVNLLNVAKAKGDANLIDLQLFDAKAEALGAIEGSFAITVADLNTGYADKGGYKFTATSNGVVDDIASPIASTGEPIIESVGPASDAAVGDIIILRGYKFTGTTGITMDGAVVLEFTVYDDNTLAMLVPATVTGTAPIIVTNATGASAAFAYVAAT
jgi:hypothetical protein